MRLIWAYAIGLLFGTGIVLSGMANPAKVLNFFDVAGTWDPSLAFVMGGALGVTALGYRLVLVRPRPLLEPAFHLPSAQGIDLRLLGGAALFGVGWGVAGFCPGGALPALGTGRWEVLLFAVFLVLGILAARALSVSPGSRPPGEGAPSRTGRG